MGPEERSPAAVGMDLSTVFRLSSDLMSMFGTASGLRREHTLGKRGCCLRSGSVFDDWQSAEFRSDMWTTRAIRP
jgi:hypothetical protein